MSARAPTCARQCQWRDVARFTSEPIFNISPYLQNKFSTCQVVLFFGEPPCQVPANVRDELLLGLSLCHLVSFEQYYSTLYLQEWRFEQYFSFEGGATHHFQTRLDLLAASAGSHIIPCRVLPIHFLLGAALSHWFIFYGWKESHQNPADEPSEKLIWLRRSLRRGGATHHFQTHSLLSHTILIGRWMFSQSHTTFVETGLKLNGLQSSKAIKPAFLDPSCVGIVSLEDICEDGVLQYLQK